MDQDIRVLERTTGLLPEDVLSSIRRLTVAAVITALVYSFVMVSSRTQCYGDASAPQTCVSLQLRPSTLFLIAIAAVAVGMLIHVLSRVSDADRAVVLLERVITGIVIAAIVAVVGAHAWFWSMPMEGFSSGSYVFFNPLFLVADIRVDVQLPVISG